MKMPFILCASLLLSGAALAADKAPKPRPCPKGQVATTEKATGKRACFAPQMMMIPAHPAGGSMARPSAKAKTP